MIKMELALLRSKFRGSMLGVLVGDCIGSPYEGEETLTPGMKTVLQQSFDKLERTEFKAPVMQFTDDSAMTRSLAESLVERKSLDIVDVARRFVKSYYQEPTRGYGASIVTVFQKLRANKLTDIISPAKDQYNGLGSFGNGGAMRVAPLSLFCYNDHNKLIDYVKKETEITHTHKWGINGAILQALAVQQSINLNPSEELNVSSFVDNLIDKMDKIEADQTEDYLELDEGLYKDQLCTIKELISENGDRPHDEKVVQTLGVGLNALYSVPTAIFCFLRAQRPIKGIKTDNPLRRAIQYAITLGGDTDTIASMTGAIAGAFYGEEKFSPLLLEHCEVSEQFRELADKLLDVATQE
ncbi:poly(ADP-ribose) glycohydrolase ARH3 isoform X1 [Harpegnathos saltator]|nr:poly(ADP-ribose) glycohydrolase ARH3 isoform X1 [Harpegnathos saltator]